MKGEKNRWMGNDGNNYVYIYVYLYIYIIYIHICVYIYMYIQYLNTTIRCF